MRSTTGLFPCSSRYGDNETGLDHDSIPETMREAQRATFVLLGGRRKTGLMELPEHLAPRS